MGNKKDCPCIIKVHIQSFIKNGIPSTPIGERPRGWALTDKNYEGTPSVEIHLYGCAECKTVSFEERIIG